MSSGEEKIWNTLAAASPEEVCIRTGAGFDIKTGLYTLRSFGRDFHISPRDRSIFPDSEEEANFLKKIGYFFRMAAMGYLVLSKRVPRTGRLINPINMKAGQLFFRGSHVLPLDKAAEKYGSDKDSFLKRGAQLGGQPAEYGDASVSMFPFPNMPAVLILWLTDEEFEARADLLFDAASEGQMPVDVIWSAAMMTVIAFL